MIRLPGILLALAFFGRPAFAQGGVQTARLRGISDVSVMVGLQGTKRMGPIDSSSIQTQVELQLQRVNIAIDDSVQVGKTNATVYASIIAIPAQSRSGQEVGLAYFVQIEVWRTAHITAKLYEPSIQDPDEAHLITAWTSRGIIGVAANQTEAGQAIRDAIASQLDDLANDILKSRKP